MTNQTDRVSLSAWVKAHDLSKTIVWKRCQAMQIPVSDGLSPEAVTILEKEFNVKAKAIAPEPPPAAATVSTVEVGNHRIIVATPQLPQTFSLEGLRPGQAAQFENPLDVAAQFITAAKAITGAMNSDLEQRQQLLDQTRAASKAVQQEAEKLALEARLYQIQTQSLDRDVSTETAELQRRLAELQALGKPAEPPQSEPQSY